MPLFKATISRPKPYTCLVNAPLVRYAITDRTQFPQNGLERGASFDYEATLNRQAAQLAGDGVDYLQLREKDLDAGALASLARSLLRTLHGSSTKLLVNARADVAVAVRAHGVHLTSSPDELTPRQVQALYGQAGLPAPVVTVSCHSLEDVAHYRLEPVTAMLFGPVFEKVVSGRKTATEAAGLALLQEACVVAAPVPVLALGGITAERVSVCLQAGARGVAGIRLFRGF
jgi:thiamine-phosphate pyrophosphorylase